ncbi:MAG: SRPBCC family protein [Tepidiformaceae bacterium]
MPQTRNDSLTITLPSDREIVGSRTFDAPRGLVFEAHTKPEHLVHWWGLESLSVCEVDLRPGGAWRFVERNAKGEEFGFRGEYREISPPERLVYTFEYDGMPGQGSIETLTFEERDGRTIVSSHTLFDSREDRDAMLESGMEEGANVTYNRLDAYLEKLR